MKKFANSFRGKTLVCALCVTLSTTLLSLWSSFIFLGEPEIPECLKEE